MMLRRCSEVQDRARLQRLNLAGRDGSRRQLQCSADPRLTGTLENSLTSFGSVPPLAGPVAHQAVEYGIGNDRWKRQVEQSARSGHTNFKTQAKRLFGNRHKPGNLCLYLTLFKVKAQPYLLPRRAQFSANRLRNTGENGFFNIGQLPQLAGSANPSEQQIDHSRSRSEVHMQNRHGPQRLQPNRADIRELRDPRHILVERHLLGGNQIDFEGAPQPGSEIMCEVPRKNVIQQADGSHLLVADLSGAGKAIWLHSGFAARFGSILPGASRLEQSVYFILLKRLFHTVFNPYRLAGFVLGSPASFVR